VPVLASCMQSDRFYYFHLVSTHPTPKQPMIQHQATHFSSKSSSQLQVLAQSSVDGFTEAFVGGSVGVMSVAIIVELQKLKGKSLGKHVIVSA
jgi:hypothetical protein